MSDDYTLLDPEERERLEAEWQAKRAAARGLAEAMWIGPRFAMQSSQPGMRMGIIDHLRRRDPAFAAADVSDLERALDDVIMPLLRSRSSDIVEIFVNLYARRLTVEQMEYATSFYESPIGQQLRMLEPELNESMSFAVSAWMSRTVPELIAEHQDALRSRGFPISSERMAPR